MTTIKNTSKTVTTVPVYRFLGRDYIDKSNFIYPALLTFKSTPNKQKIHILSDTQGETFTTLFSIAVNCGFSNWTTKIFTEPIRNIDFKVYRKIPSGNFMIRTDDVARIVEGILTAPFAANYAQIDDVIINMPSKFLEWWKNTAINEIEKLTRNTHSFKTQSLFDDNAGVTSDRNDAINKARDTSLFDKLCLSGKSMETLTELDLLAFKINDLIAADLPHVLAVKTAINIRRQRALIDDYAPIIEFIKRINPSINI